MSFFQNPFTNDFIGTWVLGDRQDSPDFKVPRNSGRGDEILVVHAKGPYNLSGNDASGNSKAVLLYSFALNNTLGWTDSSVTISGASLSAITPAEIKTSLEADALFNDFFSVSMGEFSDDRSQRLMITQRQPITKMRSYIRNGRAESVLKFNKFAGVAELPTYFDRHTIANRYNFTDGQNQLIGLLTTGEDANVINNAVDTSGNSLGYSSGTVHADYELLDGRSGLFLHYKYTYDGSGRLTQVIEYSSGADAGDLAKKTTYSYTAANTYPDKKAEVPYTLQNTDIVVP
jgi:hypothetical protein